MELREASHVPTLEYERRLLAAGAGLVAGVDEVGRGSWAGPVVAAAVILPTDDSMAGKLAGVRDSKELSPAARLEAMEAIRTTATAIGVGWASHHVVDRQGLAAANRSAMLRAVGNLPIRPDGLILDAVRLPESPLPQIAITKGDRLSLSVAAASIVAKVIRDRWMTACDARFPGYGFRHHKGYGTARHRSALLALGPCPLHRRSFDPVAACLEPSPATDGS